jgi:hypothetical protein
MKNKGQVPQAFPDNSNYGMTLQEYFAAQAMQAMIANPAWFGSRRWDTQEEMAEDYAMEAFILAEAMMLTARGVDK